ncbi:MAG: glycosyltransferase, partial [Spirochaetota bacterium]
MVRTSLIAVTKDRVEMVQKALPSWRELKGNEEELIVVDGDSKDGTYELLKKEEGKLVDLLIHEPDRSEAEALNKGFLKARGIIIKIITDDDIYYSKALEKAYDTMIEYPGIDILITGGVRALVDEDGVIGKVINYQWLDEKSSINSIESLIGIC